MQYTKNYTVHCFEMQNSWWMEVQKAAPKLITNNAILHFILSRLYIRTPANSQ